MVLLGEHGNYYLGFRVARRLDRGSVRVSGSGFRVFLVVRAGAECSIEAHCLYA